MMKNKRIFYVILIVVILAIVGISLFALKKPSTISTLPETESKDAILLELEKLNIEVTGQPKQIELQLPATLSDANWGLKKIVCEKGGYNLSTYAGKTLLFASYPINEVYKNEEPLKVWVVSSGDNKIVCIYKTVREGSTLVPGVFSVKKNPYIKKK